MKAFLSGLSLVALANAQNTYVATFSGDNNITGTVTIDNGHVLVDMMVPNNTNLPGGFDTCIDGGLKYHIHMLWGYGTTDDRFGSTACGADYTGGHWDPWHGCGSASGNAYCSNKGGCIDTGDYSADYDSDAFSAEVGDWNGKYGKITVDSNGTYMMARNDSSFFEVTPDDVFANMSVVFHCGDSGSRAFCAPFVESSTAASKDIPEQTDQGMVFATMGESYIYFDSNGSISLTWDNETLVEAEENGFNFTKECASGQLAYGIFETGDSTWNYNSMGFYATGSDCDDYVGGRYDPTHQCMPFSASEYCYGSTSLCNDTAYDYDCDFENERYSCAPGDISGKLMEVNNSILSIYTFDRSTLIPRVDDLEGMMFVMFCGDDNSSSYADSISTAVCAPIIADTDGLVSTTTLDPDADYRQVAAWLGTEGVQGYVSVDYGEIHIRLNISESASLPDGYDTCVDGGLKYHIHTKWAYDEAYGLVNDSACGGDYTGGHYDPWHGCGSASGNAYCSGKGGCIDNSDYSADYDNDAFSAEVGDWNGKYGLAEVDDDGWIIIKESSFWEVTPDDVVNMSVVFHCNGGSRAFCAGFTDEFGFEANMTIPYQDGSIVQADFSSADGFTDDSMVYFHPNGSFAMSVDVTDVLDTTGCSEWSYGLFSPSADLDGGAMVGDDCESYVDGFYDPTHQCMDFSDSEYCWGSDYLCNETDYSYNCDYDDDRYSCAPGDFSGKFGKMQSTVFEVAEDGPDTLIPKTDDMVGYVFVIYCGDNDDDISYLACAEITEYDGVEGDGALAQTVVVAAVATLFAMLF